MATYYKSNYTGEEIDSAVSAINDKQNISINIEGITAQTVEGALKEAKDTANAALPTTTFNSFKSENTTAIADAKKAGTDAAAALEAYKTINDQAVSTNTTNISNLQDTVKSGVTFKGRLSTLPTTTNYKNGDLIIVGTKEYILLESGSSKSWIELGDEGTHLTKATADEYYVPKAQAITGYKLAYTNAKEYGSASKDSTTIITNLASRVSSGYIPQYFSSSDYLDTTTINGVLLTGTPTKNPHCVNKQYADKLVDANVALSGNEDELSSVQIKGVTYKISANADLSNVVQLTNAQTISGAKTFTASETKMVNLRLQEDERSAGCKLNFGDGDYVHLYENTDDHLEIFASKGVTYKSSSGYPFVSEKGFQKLNGTDNEVLLAGGGTKAISDLVSEPDLPTLYRNDVTILISGATTSSGTVLDQRIIMLTGSFISSNEYSYINSNNGYDKFLTLLGNENFTSENEYLQVTCNFISDSTADYEYGKPTGLITKVWAVNNTLYGGVTKTVTGGIPVLETIDIGADFSQVWDQFPIIQNETYRVSTTCYSRQIL